MQSRFWFSYEFFWYESGYLFSSELMFTVRSEEASLWLSKGMLFQVTYWVRECCSESPLLSKEMLFRVTELASKGMLFRVTYWVRECCSEAPLLSKGMLFRVTEEASKGNDLEGKGNALECCPTWSYLSSREEASKGMLFTEEASKGNALEGNLFALLCSTWSVVLLKRAYRKEPGGGGVQPNPTMYNPTPQPLMLFCCSFVYDLIECRHGTDEGMEAEKKEKFQKRCLHLNHYSVGRLRCYRWSTLIKYDSYLCEKVFVD